MQIPDFRVISDFRKNHNEFFKTCFKQSVLLAMEAGLASLGHVSLDGSKFKANTSKHKAMSYKRLKEQEKQLTDEIESLIWQAEQCDAEEDKEYKERTGYEIPEDLKFKETRLKKIQAAKAALEKREKELNPDKPIDDKKQISFADHDARIMGKNGRFDYDYNAQISVDEDNQIIVGQHVSQNATDHKEVSPAIDEIQKNTGKSPEKMSADNGFFPGRISKHSMMPVSMPMSPAVRNSRRRDLSMRMNVRSRNRILHTTKKMIVLSARKVSPCR